MERFIPAQFLHDVVQKCRESCNNSDAEHPLIEKGTDYVDLADQFCFRRASESGTVRITRIGWLERPDVTQAYFDNLKASLLLAAELLAHAAAAQNKVHLGTNLDNAKAFVVREFLNVDPPVDRSTGEIEMHTEHPHLPRVYFIRKSTCPSYKAERSPWCCGYPGNTECNLYKPKWREGPGHTAVCLGCWDQWIYQDSGEHPTIPELQELVYRIICQRMPHVNPNPVHIPNEMPQSILNIRGQPVWPNPRSMWKVTINGTPEQASFFLRFFEKHCPDTVLALPEHKIPMPQCQAEILTARDRLKEQRCPEIVRTLLESSMGELKEHEQFDKKLNRLVSQN